MNLHLFRRSHSCNDLGVCQRTGPQCRKQCQRATEQQPQAQPIGYEAARTDNVLHFPTYAEWRARQGLEPVNPLQAQPEPEWIYTAGKAATIFMVALAVLALAGWAWEEWGHHLQRIYWAMAALYA